MIQYTALIKKFDQQGEKTGWTYIEVPPVIALQLNPNSKKSFRVKGKLDDYAINKVALIPMGEGWYIMALNATMRKHLKKQKGALVQVQLEVDEQPIEPPADLLECLADEPVALNHFKRLPKSHQNYYTRWIESAKTDATKAKRIALAIAALATCKSFSEMIREQKKNKADLTK